MQATREFPGSDRYRVSLAALVLFVLATTGCTTSVHPVLLKENLSADVDLAGKWMVDPPQGEGKPAMERTEATIEKGSQPGYFDIQFGKEEMRYDALRVGKVGEISMLELKGTPSLSDSPFHHGLPVHGFAKFEVKGDELWVYPLDEPKMQGLLKEHKLDYLLLNDPKPPKWVVITANTKDLQQFITSAADRVFNSKPTVFKRVVAK